MSNIVVSEYFSFLVLSFVAAGIIYTGAHENLEEPNTPSITDAQRRPDSRQEVVMNAPISSGEAWLLPILGSIVLLTLWLMLKYLNGDIVRMIFALYFAVAGVVSVWAMLLALTRVTLSDSFWKRFKLHEVPVQIPLYGRVFMRFRAPTAFLAVLSVLPSALYLWQRGPDGFEESPSHAILNDIIAVSLAFGTLNVLQLDGFKTGCILLTGLFFYDIWWVFGTRVMVDVAKGLDAPVLILWPRSLVPGSGFTMLGLGDVVLPGSFIAACLRFDQSRRPSHSERGGLLTSRSTSSFAKPYFESTLLAYIVGLNITSVAVQLSQRAQPALLYLSPACIGAFLFTAWKRKELATAWYWKHDGKSSRSTPARADAEVIAIEADVEIASSVESPSGARRHPTRVSDAAL